ncbi:flavin-dependent oxidoreductase [Sedimentitalea sp. XS_ASV28]|uniref:flavin-dependent oxidoreductase n=1 Tax=Sedimentitalea sp. XS_ASV28 TaxID=3241296 RepID=UPI0035178CCD
MSEPHVLIAGGGIGGLTLALTLHQIGVRATVFEAAREMRPLGVGINLQPNAVRELMDLGIGTDALDTVGLPAREWALVGLNGREIYAEPRGLEAGYAWPQYAMHRGLFHVLLYETVINRLGPDAVRMGTRVSSYEHLPDGRVSVTCTDARGDVVRHDGTLLIGADGIHSTIRAQMYPDQPPIHWGGILMWRGTTRMRPIRTGSSFVGLGTHRHRMVVYPISHPDPDGICTVNWIAEQTVAPGHRWEKSGWFRPVEIDSFAHEFDGFRYDWLDVPAMLRASDIAYENPMIDRNPIPTWVDGPVALMGDAAHAMYPTGSNGASQAIVDARVLGQSMVARGVTPDALAAYDAALCAPVSQLVLRNREAGPFGLLNLVHERCGGAFDNIDEVIPPDERAAFVAGYKQAAGFAIERLNAAPPTIPQGAKVAAAR